MIDEMAEKLQRQHDIEEFADITSSSQVNKITWLPSPAKSLLIFLQ